MHCNVIVLNPWGGEGGHMSWLNILKDMTRMPPDENVLKVR